MFDQKEEAKDEESSESNDISFEIIDPEETKHKET